MRDVNNPSIDLTGYQVRLDNMQISLVKSEKPTLWSKSTLLPSSTVGSGCQHVLNYIWCFQLLNIYGANKQAGQRQISNSTRAKLRVLEHDL